MVTLTTADNALKSVYLNVLSNQLNINANPLLAKIKQTSKDVWGKEIVKLAPYGLNGGVGAGTENGSLPKSGENLYQKFVTTLKNLYGTIELSDKSIRASQNNAGAFVNLLNAEMENLIKSSAFNLGRMLYGNGKGFLCGVVTHTVNTNTFTVDSVRNLQEGMIVDVYNAVSLECATSMSGRRITKINRDTKTITVDTAYATAMVHDNDYLVMQNSYNKEITGLGAVFATSGTIYGLQKSTYMWLNPYIDSTTTAIGDNAIQTMLDTLEEKAGSTIDFISCAYDVRRYYQTYLATYKRNVEVTNLEGGFKAISFAGVPIVADRFVENGNLFALNTKDFTLHQLCDWEWLESDNGKIITQKQGYPAYTATLVKYADLICDHIAGQGKMSAIASAQS